MVSTIYIQHRYTDTQTHRHTDTDTQTHIHIHIHTDTQTHIRTYTTDTQIYYIQQKHDFTISTFHVRILPEHSTAISCS